MTTADKIAQLRNLIWERLLPLIPGDCVLLDCPYYANVGDTLIWEGELAFLRESGRRLVGYGSFSTWLFPPLDPQTVILLSGGGSFGDLWRRTQEFRLQVIAIYPENPIVILPQSIYYDDAELMRRDAEAMARHPRLTICARDRHSEALLRKHFRNDILLLPDMAFCIPPENLLPYCSPKPTEGTLLLRRTDKEAAEGSLPAEVPAEVAVRDWPTLERTGFRTWLLYKLCGACDLLGRIGSRFLRGVLAHRADALALNTVRRRNIRAGVRFLSSCDSVYSTRLHGAILSILLGKPETYMLDNRYGKNSAFYRTWLQDVEGVHLLGTQNHNSHG